jgi:hypothetical protein
MAIWNGGACRVTGFCPGIFWRSMGKQPMLMAFEPELPRSLSGKSIRTASRSGSM